MRNMKNEPISATEISVAAVKQYISLAPENRKRHLANILIHANGIDFSSGVRFVSAKASEDAVEIVVEELSTVYGDCFNTFTLKDSSFAIFCKTLQIKTSNALGQNVTVEITGI